MHLLLHFAATLIHFTPTWHNSIDKFRHIIYIPDPQLDVVQLNAPKYDLDIDGQPDPVTDIQSLNTESVKEDTVPDTTNSEHHTALSSNTNRLESQPSLE